MTAERALTGARDRWGASAAFMYAPIGTERCLLGVLGRHRFYVIGRGQTWQEALDRADEDSIEIHFGDRSPRRFTSPRRARDGR